MGNFAIDIRQWKTVDEFTAHLKAHDPAIASWAMGVVIHHTWRPLQSQWQGRTSIEGLKVFYENKTPPWDAGPHLFICSGAPNPDDNGIWQMTPLNMIGVHAGVCNNTTWGIEVVGDYDNEQWSASTRSLVVGATAALLSWRSLSVTVDSLKGHRDCHSPKTCPGNAIDMSVVRAWVTAAMNPTPQPVTITPNSPIIAEPRCTIQQAYQYIMKSTNKPAYTSGDFLTSILPAYFALATDCGVDPCIAIAQTIHETGNFSSWWSQRPRRNSAGLGVTGESSSRPPVPEEQNKWAYDSTANIWRKGLVFSAWTISILAQMGRLTAYAVPQGQRTTKQQEIVTQALMMRSLPVALQGTAPTLVGLNGKWAYPGTMYAQQIAAIATKMAQEKINTL